MKTKVREFEDSIMFTQFHADRIMYDGSDGITESSKGFFRNSGKKIIGVPESVVIFYFKEAEPSDSEPWGFFTYVMGTNRECVRFTGFAWGYSGEGSRGLVWLCGEIGFTIDMAKLPPAHHPGAWKITPDGSVFQIEGW